MWGPSWSVSTWQHTELFKRTTTAQFPTHTHTHAESSFLQPTPTETLTVWLWGPAGYAARRSGLTPGPRRALNTAGERPSSSTPLERSGSSVTTRRGTPRPLGSKGRLAQRTFTGFIGCFKVTLALLWKDTMVIVLLNLTEKHEF